MFKVQLLISSIKFNLSHTLRPRFYLRIQHFHYFLSDCLQIKGDVTTLLIESSFYVAQNSPSFEILLLLPSAQAKQKTQNIIGKTEIDIRQWPIDAQKTRIIDFSTSIMVQVSIKSTFLSQGLILGQSQEISNLSLLQWQQKQKDLNEQNNFLSQKNMNLKQQYYKLLGEREQLQMKVQQTKGRISENCIYKEKVKQQSLRQLNILKLELQRANKLLGELINLVNSQQRYQIVEQINTIFLKKTSQL